MITGPLLMSRKHTPSPQRSLTRCDKQFTYPRLADPRQLLIWSDNRKLAHNLRGGQPVPIMAPCYTVRFRWAQITQGQTIEEKFPDGADGCARRAADAPWPLHHFRIQRPRAAGRSGCAGTRKFERQDRPACARALAMPDW